MIAALLAAGLAVEPSARVAVERVPTHPTLDRWVRARGGAVPGTPRPETAAATLVAHDGACAIVTNHHVVAGARSIEVELADGRLIGVDPATVRVGPDEDLAWLGRLAVGPCPPLAPWPDPTTPVHATGPANGVDPARFEGSTAGTVSWALPHRASTTYGRLHLAVAPGLSGAPVISPSGAVVGVIVAGSRADSPLAGDGLAIPGERVAAWLARYASSSAAGGAPPSPSSESATGIR